jgi:hypothetical protein
MNFVVDIALILKTQHQTTGPASKSLPNTALSSPVLAENLKPINEKSPNHRSSSEEPIARFLPANTRERDL